MDSMHFNLVSNRSLQHPTNSMPNRNCFSLPMRINKLGKINTLAIIGYVAAACLYPSAYEMGIMLGIGTAFTASIGNFLAGNRISALFHSGVIVTILCFHNYNSELARQARFNEFQIQQTDFRALENTCNSDAIDPTQKRLDDMQILYSKNQGIVMGEYGVTNKDSEQPIIESFGANPCVVVAMYNEETSRTVVAHIHAATKVPQGIKMLEKEALKAGPGKLVVELASGTIKDNSILLKVKEAISKINNMNLNAIHHAEQLAMDARFGNTSITLDLVTYSLTELHNMALRSFKGALSSALTLGADGTKRLMKKN